MAFQLLNSFKQTVPKRPGSAAVEAEILLIKDTDAWFKRYKIVFRAEDYINCWDMSNGEPGIIDTQETTIYTYFNLEKAEMQYDYLRNRAIATNRFMDDGKML